MISWIEESILAGRKAGNTVIYPSKGILEHELASASGGGNEEGILETSAYRLKILLDKY